MRVLQLTKKFPFPHDDGESIAVYNLIRGLTFSGAEVDLLSLNTTKDYTDITEVNANDIGYSSIETIDIDNSVSYWGAFKNLWTRNSYHVERIISEAYERKLTEILQKNTYDVVLLETSYMLAYVDLIRNSSNALIILRAHNVESEIWYRLSKEQSNVLKAWYLNLCANRLEKFEVNHINSVDLLATLTEKDLKGFTTLGFQNDSIVIPVGVDLEAYQSSPPKHFESLCFIGSLDWMPNYLGLDWFLGEVWPEFYRSHPQIQFHIAGKHAMSDKVKSHEGVTFHGRVENAIDFISEHDAMIVPLFSGSGIRIKIIEAMALGKPNITTSIGMEGISATHGNNIFVANSKIEMITALESLVENKSKVSQIGKNARAYAEQNFDYGMIGERLYHSIAQKLSLNNTIAE